MSKTREDARDGAMKRRQAIIEAAKQLTNLGYEAQYEFLGVLLEVSVAERIIEALKSKETD